MSNPKFQAPLKEYIPNDPTKDINSDMKMYVLINRPILTLVQSGVQASHSITEYTVEHPECASYKNWAKNHKTLIFLQATEREMEDVAAGLSKIGKKSSKFFEPDMFNENVVKGGPEGMFTALAVEPMSSIEGKLYFGKFQLLK